MLKKTAADEAAARRQAWWLTTAAVLLVFSLGWTYGIGPARQRLQEVRAANASAAARVQELLARRAARPSAGEVADLRERLAAMDAYFGPQTDWDTLVDDLGQAVAESGLAVLQASFAPEERSANYSTRKFSLALRGSGEQALTLLRRLERFPRLVRVDGADLTFGPASAPQRVQASAFRWLGMEKAKGEATGAGTQAAGGNAR